MIVQRAASAGQIRIPEVSGVGGCASIVDDRFLRVKAGSLASRGSMAASSGGVVVPDALVEAQVLLDYSRNRILLDGLRRVFDQASSQVGVSVESH